MWKIERKIRASPSNDFWRKGVEYDIVKHSLFFRSLILESEEAFSARYRHPVV